MRCWWGGLFIPILSGWVLLLLAVYLNVRLVYGSAVRRVYGKTPGPLPLHDHVPPLLMLGGADGDRRAGPGPESPAARGDVYQCPSPGPARAAVELIDSTRFRQLNLSARSCASPHMVNVGFHDPDVGNKPPRGDIDIADSMRPIIESDDGRRRILADPQRGRLVHDDRQADLLLARPARLLCAAGYGLLPPCKG
jgi:hypothetical protein